MADKGQQLGTVKTPTGSEYPYYWNSRTGDVHVGGEYAGKGRDADDAWRKANYYATTGTIMRD